MPELTSRGKAFHSAIATFIEARRETKLKEKLKSELKKFKQSSHGEAGLSGWLHVARVIHEKFRSEYKCGPWLESAANRASNIQSVTHVLKATHSGAEGTNIYAPPHNLAYHSEIGTHSLGKDFVEDTAVTDAKHLDVFSFLKHQLDERRILDWIREDDPDLRAALYYYSNRADFVMEAFKGLIRSTDSPTSNQMAKQVYWLVGVEPVSNDNYHLLQPMFSSSLDHAVHVDIRDARFGEDNKASRKAYRARSAHDAPYRDYRNLVTRKLGGKNPQNVSQLNSERGGINYLLASLPPKWRLQQPHKLFSTASAMDRLAYFKGARAQVAWLADFLLGNPPANDKTRFTRKRMEQELGAQLALFAAEVREQFEPGWTRNADCKLPLCEKLWLDPERAELPIRDDPDHSEYADEDRAFNASYTLGDWPDEVAGRFANWVNDRLHKAGLTTVGDAEYKHWARQAIVDAAWPIPLQRCTPVGGVA